MAISVLSVYDKDTLYNELKEVNEKLKNLLQYSFEDFVKLSQSIKNFYNMIKDFSAETNNYVDNSKVDHLLKSLNNIIVDLQFHDINRQKIEHVQETNALLLDELATVDEIDNPVGYLALLNEIAQLNAAQLKFIKAEYLEKSVSIKTNITSSVIKNAVSLEDLVFDFKNTFNYTPKFEATIEEIIAVYKKLAEAESVANDNKMELLDRVKATYTMKTERDIFNEVFGIEEEAEDEEDIELF